ncbi:alpha/beta hydrolase [Pseudonocardiaceae bacterium YIM PH 21723]|nr:alpha/beta hydrolase [Pseudonocardiaceae bacterium YIM PH 21723]
MNPLQKNNVTVLGPENGRPVLLAHGYGCDQNMWRWIAPGLAAHHRVVLFDHVGSGHSDLTAWRPDRYSSLQAYAEDVLGICRELNLRDAVLVGHSVSAMIAVLAAVTDPQRFAQLVLLTPSPRYIDDAGYRGGFGSEDIETMLNAVDQDYLGWSRAITPVIMGNPDRPELSHELLDSFCRTDPRIARAFARVTFLSDTRAELDRVSTPTLVLRCTEDPIAPPEAVAFVHERIRGSHLVTLPATGHCPHVSAPEATLEAITAFINGQLMSSAPISD